MAEYLANSFLEEGIILNEEIEIVQYGLETLEGDLLSGILVLAIGVGFGHVAEAVFLWVGLFALRRNAGGFHAKTKIGCFIVSTGMLILDFIIFVFFQHSMIFYGICGLITGGIIWKLAPIANHEKQLDLIEYKVYKRRSRIILSLEEGILLVALWFETVVIIKSVAMVLFLVSISLLLETIRNICCVLRLDGTAGKKLEIR